MRQVLLARGPANDQGRYALVWACLGPELGLNRLQLGRQLLVLISAAHGCSPSYYPRWFGPGRFLGPSAGLLLPLPGHPRGPCKLGTRGIDATSAQQLEHAVELAGRTVAAWLHRPHQMIFP